MGIIKHFASWFKGLVSDAQTWRNKMRTDEKPGTPGFPKIFRLSITAPDNKKLFRSKKNKEGTKSDLDDT